MSNQQKKNITKPNESRSALLQGTAEKLLFFIVWLSLALIRPQWWVQGFLCVVGVSCLHWGVPSGRYKWRFVFIALSFIMAGTIGLIIVTGHEPFDALFRFSFAGVWWGITADSISYAALPTCRSLIGRPSAQHN